MATITTTIKPETLITRLSSGLTIKALLLVRNVTKPSHSFGDATIVDVVVKYSVKVVHEIYELFLPLVIGGHLGAAQIVRK